MSEEKRRVIRSLRLTYGVTFVAFRDLGVVVGPCGGGGVSNALRTVGTLGRGELSPPIKITD